MSKEQVAKLASDLEEDYHTVSPLPGTQVLHWGSIWILDELFFFLKISSLKKSISSVLGCYNLQLSAKDVEEMDKVLQTLVVIFPQKPTDAVLNNDILQLLIFKQRGYKFDIWKPSILASFGCTCIYSSKHDYSTLVWFKEKAKLASFILSKVPEKVDFSV